jgi:hypothetical protein
VSQDLRYRVEIDAGLDHGGSSMVMEVMHPEGIYPRSPASAPKSCFYAVGGSPDPPRHLGEVC